MKTHYAINLKIVRLADAADAVKRIQTEVSAGRKTGGSVDLLWVNGENFRTLKRPIYYKPAGRRLCPTGAMSTHSFRCGKIFSVPTEGAESPGRRTTDVYRPPRCYATATTNAASLTGVC